MYLKIVGILKNVLIDTKKYKDLVIYFTRHVRSKSIKMLSPYYHELIEQIQNMKKKIFIG